MIYTEQSLNHWIATVKRQRVKDELFLDRIDKYFHSGNVLEIGAGCGQLSAILASRGYNVVSSDLQPFFVDYMKSQGLTSLVVDATEISAYVDEKFDNILAQGLSTIVSTDLSLVRKTYQSVFESLKNNGRFIFIFPNAYRSKKWSAIETHLDIIHSTGFKIIDIFRDQILPSSYYAKFNKSILNFVELHIGKYFGIRYVIVLEK